MALWSPVERRRSTMSMTRFPAMVDRLGGLKDGEVILIESSALLRSRGREVVHT